MFTDPNTRDVQDSTHEMFTDPNTRDVQDSTPEQLSRISSDIKLIDLGLASVGGNSNNKVPALLYRAPEVVLGTGLVEKSDVWSLGCIFFELWTKCSLFQAAENSKELLLLMTSVIGPIPPNYINYEPFTFENESEAQRFIKRMAELQPYLHPLEENHNPRTMGIGGHEEEQFMDLLKKMLTWKTECRLATRDALKHLYFG